MKYTIKAYQVIYDTGHRDKVNLDVPIVTDDVETERTKLIMEHSGIGKKCIGLNLDTVKHNINDR